MEKMEIFISWHGQGGHAVATALMEWLPQIANAFKPWLSSRIDKGSRWRTQIATRLAKAKAGIICLTPSALTSPWLLFEAGAIAKPPEKTYACTLLIDLQWEDVTDPLAQFQHTATTKKEFLELVKTLNSALGKDQLPPAQIEKSFEKWWPDLEEALQKLPSDEPTKSPERNQKELLGELIDLARRTNAQVTELARQDRIEATAGAGYYQGRVPGIGMGQLVNLRALVNPLETMYNLDLPAGAAFVSPAPATSATETLAAQTTLKHASQPDDLPPPQRKRHAIPP